MHSALASQLQAEIISGLSYHALGRLADLCTHEIDVDTGSVSAGDMVALMVIRSVCRALQSRLNALAPVPSTLHQSIEQLMLPAFDAAITSVGVGDQAALLDALAQLIRIQRQALRLP